MFLTGYLMLLNYIYSFSFVSILLDDKKQNTVILSLFFLLRRLNTLLDDCLQERGKIN